MTEASFSMRHVWAGVAGSAAMLGAGAAEAAFTPPNLPPGSSYRLIFTTNSFFTAASADIATYNSIVTTEATENPDLPATTWKAIGSTSAVAATDNIACGPGCDDAPIYNVNGVKIADSIADFFDGTILVALTTDQSGQNAFDSVAKVWTGSTTTGARFGGRELGTALPITGLLGETTNGLYVSEPAYSYGNAAGWHLYGISGALSIPTPPDTVPAPGGIALMLLGLGALGAAGMRRGRPAA